MEKPGISIPTLSPSYGYFTSLNSYRVLLKMLGFSHEFQILWENAVKHIIRRRPISTAFKEFLKWDSTALHETSHSMQWNLKGTVMQQEVKNINRLSQVQNHVWVLWYPNLNIFENTAPRRLNLSSVYNNCKVLTFTTWKCESSQMFFFLRM